MNDKQMMTNQEFDEVSKSMRDVPMVKAAHCVLVLGWSVYQARMHWEVTETSIKSAVARLKKKAITRAAAEIGRVSQ